MKCSSGIAFRAGSCDHNVEILRSGRKRVAIEVYPDLSIVVRAPDRAHVHVIHGMLLEKRRWIQRQLRFFSSFLPRTPERRFISGETHLYLGRQYRLKVLQSTVDEGVKLRGGEIVIRTKESQVVETKRCLLEQWYTQHAHRVLSERFEECLRHSSFRRLPKPLLTIRRMKRRWGSCSRGGRIALNVDLIRAPRICIDYVVMHELCHLIVQEHSRAFDRLLLRTFPHATVVKARLERLLV